MAYDSDDSKIDRAVWISIAVLVIVIPVSGLAAFFYNKKHEPEQVKEVADTAVANSFVVKILDVRKEKDCDSETLMEKIGDKNFRFTRCGFFGNVGETFWWYAGKGD